MLPLIKAPLHFSLKFALLLLLLTTGCPPATAAAYDNPAAVAGAAAERLSLPLDTNDGAAADKPLLLPLPAALAAAAATPAFCCLRHRAGSVNSPCQMPICRACAFSSVIM